jgi:hypothetical protein
MDSISTCATGEALHNTLAGDTLEMNGLCPQWNGPSPDQNFTPQFRDSDETRIPHLPFVRHPVSGLW